MSIGKIREYDPKNGTWTSYSDRIEMYFVANSIREELKMPTLISLMGDEAYELLLNLASPRTPAALTYNEASALLRNHLQPTPSVLAERYRFRQRRQAEAENISEYVAELKKLARYCQFGESLGENMRDQFVCGLKSDIIRQRLFADDLADFAGAVKLATALEAAERDAAAVEVRAAPGAEAAAVHAMRSSAGTSAMRRGKANGGGRGPAFTGQQRAVPAGQPNCKGCGATGHNYGECRFRDYVCSKCKRTGHLRRVCAAWSGPGQRPGGRAQPSGERGMYYGDAEYDAGGRDHYPEDDYVDLHQLCLRDYRAVSLPILINDVLIPMEIDTGSAISCISKDTYDRHFHGVCISPCQLSLRFYDGSHIRPLGYIQPRVKYDNKVKVLELFVIDGGTTALLGRQWLAELQINIPAFHCNNIVNKDGDINVLLNRYKELFDGSLGRFTGCEATLRVREGAVPVYHRARPMPFAYRERVDAELDAMLRAGVIEPVDCSDWASPLVPVNKADGSLRVCVDYKGTLNPVLVVDRYPLPKIDDVLVALNGAKYFSKIDLSQSYNQIVLDDSKKYTVINTHRGLFRYNRLVFGLSSSPGIFQRIMTNLLQGIPNVGVFIDDVIIGGKTRHEHLNALSLVFERMLASGLRLRENKCVFLVPEVSYLGYILSENGIRVDPAKIEAIVNIPRPQNVPELRSFLGLANFFAKFVKNFSQILVPLYNLLKKGIEWYWTQECEWTFHEVKKLLTSPQVLAHYNPNMSVILTCDASPTGIGGVISQPCGPGGAERPVAFVSRTLTSAEKNYSQIHREALAIVFCMKKFHQYLYGRKFTLRTDHKPLVSIFGPNNGIPTMTASRMQRWAIILSAYNYDIEYVKTDDNSADGLSRLPLRIKEQVSAAPEQTYLHFAQEALLLDYNELKKYTSRDPTLGKILGYIRDGWPSACDVSTMQPYYNRRNELYEELGCIMWGHRVVIPEQCKTRVLKMLHEPHMGIVKSKSLARSYVWWAGVDEAVEAMCRECGVCAAQADAPPRQAPRPWAWPGRPWSRLHLDFLGPIFGKTYLVIVDAMSKWLEIYHVPSTAANWSIGKLTELWARWGLPKQIVSDNGPPFTSTEFALFIKNSGIEHIFTAPYHPSSNGAAENAVKTLKRVIKKAHYEKQDIDKALHTFLLYYRNTEHTSTGESPAMVMLGRRLRTKLDALKPDREGRASRVQQRQAEDAGGADRTVRVGDDVWFRQFLKGEKWLPGKVECKIGPSNFRVLSEGGDKQVHRHIDQLKRRSRSSLVCPNTDRSFQQKDIEVSSPLVEEGKIPDDESFPSSNTSRELDSPHQSEQSRSSGSSPYASAPSSPEPTQDPQNESLPECRPIRKCRLRNLTYKNM